MKNSTIQDAKNYYLQYTISWLPVTDDIIPLSILTYDATAQFTYDCQISYDIPGLADGQIHNLTSFSKVSMDFSLVFLEVHQHIGGVNYTVDHYRNGTHLGRICAQEPVYGSGGVDVPGNETGYLVSIPTCTFDTPYQIQAGDELRLESIYDKRGIAGGHTWHAGVMGLVFLFGQAHLNHSALCEDKLFQMCGPPPYVSEDHCKQCLTNEYVQSSLKDFGCTTAELMPECSKTAPPNTVPTPPGVDGMTLSYTQLTGSTYRLNLTAPADRWFAIGFNKDADTMDGAAAWVYADGDDGTPMFSERSLGNHEPGNVTWPSYPCSGEKVGDHIQAIFQVELDLSGSRNCVLFAHAPSATMKLGYHGSSRGTTCFNPGDGHRAVGRPSPLWSAWTHTNQLN